jgi:acyl-coenzyme A thioesterase PaaI-like protein
LAGSEGKRAKVTATPTGAIAIANVTRLGGRVGPVQMALHNEQGLLITTGAGAYVVG